MNIYVIPAGVIAVRTDRLMIILTEIDNLIDKLKTMKALTVITLIFSSIFLGNAVNTKAQGKGDRIYLKLTAIAYALSFAAYVYFNY